MNESLKILETSTDLGAQVTCLETLNQTIILSDQNIASAIDLPRLFKIVESILNTNKSPNLCLLSLRCLYNLVQSAPQTSRLVLAISPSIISKLSGLHYIEVSELALDLIELLSHDNNESLLKQRSLNNALNIYDFCRVSAQIKIAECASNMLRRIPLDCNQLVLECVPSILKLFRSDSPRIVELGTLALSRLVNHFLTRSAKTLPKELTTHEFFRVILSILPSTEHLKPFAQCCLINIITDLLIFDRKTISIPLFELGIIGSLMLLFSNNLNNEVVKDSIFLINSLLPKLPTSMLPRTQKQQQPQQQLPYFNSLNRNNNNLYNKPNLSTSEIILEDHLNQLFFTPQQDHKSKEKKKKKIFLDKKKKRK